MQKPQATDNRHATREAWLQTATKELRPYFTSVKLPLPEKIRLAIAFPSTGRKGKRKGECWHSGNSDDEHFEIFIRADISEPVEVLGILVKELVHAALPDGTTHGKLFKGAAIKVGLEGKMRDAQPTILLQNRLEQVATTLGPLPHAKLHIDQTPLTAIASPPAKALDKPKKQKGRMLKAECMAEGCGYIVRVSALQARTIGKPHCPKHGQMNVDFPADDEEGATAADDLKSV